MPTPDAGRAAPPPLSPSMSALVSRCLQKQFAKNQVLIHEGAYEDTLFVVLSGRVKVYSRGVDEREIVYGHYGPNEYFGEMSLDGGPRSASVCAVEPTRCAVVLRKALREQIAVDPDLAFELLSRVIQSLRRATQTARNLALLEVYDRLRLLIDQLAVARPDGTRVVVEELTQKDFAARIGSSRVMVTRILGGLEQDGYIRRRRRTIELLKPLPLRC